MKVLVNSREMTLERENPTLMDVAEKMNINTESPAAMALGQDIVSRNEWETTPLKENDRITVIGATCGG